MYLPGLTATAIRAVCPLPDFVILPMVGTPGIATVRVALAMALSPATPSATALTLSATACPAEMSARRAERSA